jgi:hypothetical protein
MTRFSKSKPSKDSQVFLSEFSSRAAIQSAKLVDELLANDRTEWAGILIDQSAKLALTNCFIGAHFLYLRLGIEGEIATLFGQDVFEKSLPSLPEKARIFVSLAYRLYEKNNQHGNDDLTSSLENFYKIKINPLDACVAFTIYQQIRNSEEFSPLIGDLLPILNRLQIQQIEWLKVLTDTWTKAR